MEWLVKTRSRPFHAKRCSRLRCLFFECDSQLSDEQQQQPKHQKAVYYHNCTTARSFSAQQTTILLRCLLVRWSVTTNNLSVCAQSPDDWCDKIFDNLFFFSSTEALVMVY
jgi:hypothetical protein